MSGRGSHARCSSECEVLYQDVSEVRIRAPEQSIGAFFLVVAEYVCVNSWNALARKPETHASFPFLRMRSDILSFSVLVLWYLWQLVSCWLSVLLFRCSRLLLMSSVSFQNEKLREWYMGLLDLYNHQWENDRWTEKIMVCIDYIALKCHNTVVSSLRKRDRSIISSRNESISRWGAAAVGFKTALHVGEKFST